MVGWVEQNLLKPIALLPIAFELQSIVRPILVCGRDFELLCCVAMCLNF